MGKVALVIAFLAALAAAVVIWFYPDPQTSVSEDKSGTEKVDTIISPLEAPSDPSDQVINLASLSEDSTEFEIELPSNQWRFGVVNTQAHLNGDLSLVGKDTVSGVVALVTLGARRSYATITEHDRTIELTLDAEGTLLEMREVRPGDVDLSNDFVLDEQLFQLPVRN